MPAEDLSVDIDLSVRAWALHPYHLPPLPELLVPNFSDKMGSLALANGRAGMGFGLSACQPGAPS